MKKVLVMMALCFSFSAQAEKRQVGTYLFFDDKAYCAGSVVGKICTIGEAGCKPDEVCVKDVPNCRARCEKLADPNGIDKKPAPITPG